MRCCIAGVLFFASAAIAGQRWNTKSLPALLVDGGPPNGQTGAGFILASGDFRARFADRGIQFNLGSREVSLRFTGASRRSSLQPLGAAPGQVNFIQGNDPALWRTGLQIRSGLIYKNLYPGIDMLWTVRDSIVKSEFHVAPGVRPDLIRMSYAGADSLRVDGSGALIITAGDKSLRDEAPEAYTEHDGTRRRVPARYSMTAAGSVSFIIGPYERDAALVIDPVLSFSTFLGGSRYDSATSVAAGTTGIYVAGWTESGDFPVTGGLSYRSGVDMFVAKFTTSGALSYCTFLGGTGDDRALAIAVTAAGNAVIAGSTHSSDMPTVKPIQSALRGSMDAFIAEFDAAGKSLIFATYIGGFGADAAGGVAVDSSGSVYVAGYTSSTDFPVANAFQTSQRGQQNAFALKLNPTSATLLYSTYLGGSSYDAATAIAIDSAGDAFVTGYTRSSNFPTVSPFQASNRGQQSAFVAELAATGKTLVYSSYLGGSGGTMLTPELGAGIAVDSSGAAYVAGVTSSSDFPVVSASQPTFGGSVDAFVAKVHPGGSGLAYSTYLGGSGRDWGAAIAVDSSGQAFVCGYTSSEDFPSASAVQGANAGLFDAFVTQLSPAGALVSSTYLGGSSIDSANGVTIDSTGAGVVAGHTMSPDFPLAAPVQSINKSGFSAFVAKLDRNLCSYSAIASRQSFGSTGGTGTLVISAPAGCPWIVSSNAVWLTVSAATEIESAATGADFSNGSTSGAANAALNFTVAANPSNKSPRLSSLSLSASGVANLSVPMEQNRGPVRDINGDNRSDVILYDPVSGNAHAALSNGAGGFSYANAPYTPGFDTLRLGDWNGDGKADLVLYNSVTSLAYIGLNDGAGGFTFSSLFWSPGFNHVATGDLNGDGLSDFVLHRSTDGTTYTALSNGHGGFTYRYTLVSIGYTHVRVGDFDGDGNADVFFYRETDGLAHLGLSNGAGGFTFTPVKLEPRYDFVELGDLNGDGKADLLLYSSATGAAKIGLSTGAGFNLTFRYWSPGFTSVKLFDFNGDGKSDVALYNSNSTLGYLGVGDGAGNFTFSSLFWGSGMNLVETLDLNGDGKEDALIYNGRNGAAYTAISTGNAADPFTYRYSYWGNGLMMGQ